MEHRESRQTDESGVGRVAACHLVAGGENCGQHPEDARPVRGAQRGRTRDAYGVETIRGKPQRGYGHFGGF